jgi:hypothetical protein
MVKSFLLSKGAQGLLACALAGSVFWWVVEHSGEGEGAVIIHVMELDVEVIIAGRVYYVQEATAAPFVLRLPPGTYDFRVRRRNAVLHAESFTLRGGESMVLAAISDERGALAPKCSRPTTGDPSGRN